MTGLRRIRLLQDLDAETLQQLAAACTWRRAAPGECIIARSSRRREVFFIVSGRVRVYVCSARGKEVTFRDMAEGDIVGEIAAIDFGPRSTDVVALSEALVAAVPARDFVSLLEAHPGLAVAFMQYLAQMIRLLTDRVIELSTLGVQNRIHAELLRLASQAPPAGNEARIAPVPKHAEIAARVSTTREQVAREMSALARTGLVCKSGSALVITRMDQLAHMVSQASRQA